ncbi:MAG: LPS assembly lipoprotein LptE [Planctomycetota bacterium]
MRTCRKLLRGALVTLAMALSGCGYSLGYDDFGPPGRTVAVQVVDNRSFRQRVELDLTRQILEELTIHGDLRPADRRRADTVLEVTLADVTGRTLVGAGQGFPVREGALEFVCEVRLLDGATGHVLRETEIRDRAEFRAPVGETEATAYAEASYDLARKIVLALEADF